MPQSDKECELTRERIEEFRREYTIPPIYSNGQPIEEWAVNENRVLNMLCDGALKSLSADPTFKECYACASPVTDEMVNRFLSWPLPKDFAPDCGIKFSPPKTPHPIGYWPIGTNLLTADQARRMLEHVLQ